MDPWAIHRLHKQLRQGKRLLVVAALLSMGLHATAMMMLMGAAWDARYRATQITDSPSEQSAATELVIAEESPAEMNEPMPEPAPTPPSAPTVMPLAEAAPILPDEFTRREVPAASVPTVLPPQASVNPSRGVARPSMPSVTPAPQAPKEAEVSFAGIVAPRARSVVFVVDASAPMVSSWKWLREEMMRSVARLDESQRFQVIVTRAGRVAGAAGGGEGGGAQAFPARGMKGLVSSTRENKLALAQWLLETQPAGRSDPLPGLTEALKMRPDLVFVLTHSIKRSGPDAAWGAGKDATLATLDRLNPKNAITGQRPVVIKTIQLIEEDPTGMLKAIADAHGDGAGSYRVMTLDELKE